MESRLTCQNCGTRLEEWDEKKGGERNAYLPETYICPGCHVIDNAQEAMRQERAQSKQSMMPVRVRLRPRVEVEMERLERARVKAKGKTPA